MICCAVICLALYHVYSRRMEEAKSMQVCNSQHAMQCVSNCSELSSTDEWRAGVCGV